MASPSMYTGGKLYGPDNHPSVHYGLVTTNKGYDVTAAQIGKKRKNAAMGRANGQLHDGTYFINIFVTDIRIDIALAGSRAQSQWKRDWYPRSFTQPSFVIEGQCLDQEDYGWLAEFVHQAQHKSLLNNPSSTQPNLTQLWVKGSNWPYDPIKKNGRGQQTIKGPRQAVMAKGHITSMPRNHKAAQYAPTFQFSFTVEQMLEGLYKEQAATGNKQQTWADVMTKQLGINSTTTATTPFVSPLNPAYAKAHPDRNPHA